MSEDFVGSGWPYPLRTDATGGIALVSREREVEEAMRIILSTAFGERPQRPEFGCGIHDLVFESVDAGTAGRIAHEVRGSLARWEPRINVEQVNVAMDSDDPARIYIDVRYTIGRTNDPRNLVFPFYTIPAEE